jgi:hypothetical protein
VHRVSHGTKALRESKNANEDRESELDARDGGHVSLRGKRDADGSTVSHAGPDRFARFDAARPDRVTIGDHV